jgi:2-polyprenyl-3-methyl-5-hydroxy-6-metoxy-1,4-benzoquinol methylase
MRSMETKESQPFRAGLAPSTAAVVDAVLAHWPEHAKLLRASFENRSSELLDTTEVIADLLCRVADSRARPLGAYAEDYRYLCEKIVYPEDIYFRREGRYRLSTYAEAAREVYDNAQVMARYMNGLFLSDALWVNHASAMNDFARSYLPGAKPGGNCLEIGPGHGMLLHLALRYGRFGHLSAWDVSATSIDHTRHVLSVLGEADRVNLRLQDLYSPEALSLHAGRFDTVVLSEVLEHLERPREALAIIRDLLAPGGTVWINVPANGPAPDHLVLLRSPQEAADLVSSAGLTVIRTADFPSAGFSLERSVRQALPISCVLVGTRTA